MNKSCETGTYKERCYSRYADDEANSCWGLIEDETEQRFGDTNFCSKSRKYQNETNEGARRLLPTARVAS
jgi:hypothetical protein